MELSVSLGESQVQVKEAGPLKPAIQIVEATGTYGKFTIEPLERGFATTVGNPLRRFLLSSILGAAVTWVRVDGVLHEYSTIPNVKEDVLEFSQNVKSIRLRPRSDREGRMHLSVTGPGVACAGDIMAPVDFDIVNPELPLASLTSSEGKLTIEFNVECGKGYRPASSGSGLPIGTISVDAVFSPVRKVDYTVERTRVGQVTDYERLVLEVWTDGAMTPVEALQKAAQGLVEHFGLFTAAGRLVEGPGQRSSLTLALPPEIYNMPIERLELSSRTLNCLKRAGLNKVGETLEKSKEELLRIRNFGEKSFEELINRLKEKEIPIPETLEPSPPQIEVPVDDEPFQED